MLIQRQCPSKLSKYLDLVLAAIGSGFAALIGIQVAGPRWKMVGPGVSSRSSYLTNLEQETSTSLPSLSLSELSSECRYQLHALQLLTPLESNQFTVLTST